MRKEPSSLFFRDDLSATPRFHASTEPIGPTKFLSPPLLPLSKPLTICFPPLKISGPKVFFPFSTQTSGFVFPSIMEALISHPPTHHFFRRISSPVLHSHFPTSVSLYGPVTSWVYGIALNLVRQLFYLLWPFFPRRSCCTSA